MGDFFSVILLNRSIDSASYLEDLEAGDIEYSDEGGSLSPGAV